MDPKAKQTVRKRKDGEKENLIEKLRKIPVVQIACEKLSISRSTYYRWRKEDEVFCRNADDAIEEGSSFVNDMAESQLLSAIKDRNMTAFIFWLKHHHKAYTTKVEILTSRNKDGPLSEEQKATLEKALSLTRNELVDEKL
jgi:ACT domain-containing protein